MFPVKPFLLLATRAEDEAADGEYEAMLRWSGLEERDLHRVRLKAGPLPAIDLDDYAGVIVGGGPFDSSDPEDTEVGNPAASRGRAAHAARRAGRARLSLSRRLLRHRDARRGQRTIDRTYGEPISAVPVNLTAAGLADPILEGMPETFSAFVGHKEACSVLPTTAVLLASSPACPVQMFRVKTNLYATQFHPELDVAGIITRIRVYRHRGYFAPETMDALIDGVSGAVVTQPPRILSSFVARYA